jgi:oligopeptide transport system permease protein
MSAQGLWRDGFQRFQKNKTAVAAAWVVGLLCSLAGLAPWIAPYPFDTQEIDHLFASPSLTHWLGTDSLGRDMLSRLIYGARVSMSVGIVTALLSLLIGTLYGATAGWWGGRVDAVMMRAIDILFSIPTMVLLILVKIGFDSMHWIANPELKALVGILLALSIVSWVSLARLVRGQVLQLKQMPYIEAARALGATSPSIVVRHILPNILGPTIVLLTFQIPANILFESFLSFIGLGLQPPFASWGVLAAEGWRSLRTYPHLIISPGVALFVAMLAFNLVGDGLRDAFDPRLDNR